MRQPWLLRVFWLWREEGLAYVLQRARLRLRPVAAYDPDWINANDRLTPADIARIRERIAAFAAAPCISVLLPVNGSRADDVRRSIESVLAQLYERWELCIAADRSSPPAALALIESHAARDRRIKTTFADAAETVSETGNRALAAASGELVALLDAGDRLAAHALYMVAEEANRFPDTTVIYTDEDRIDQQGRRSDPQFKSDWNPDLLRSRDYIGRLVVYRRGRMAELGGFRREFDASRDYDLALRVIECAPPATIRHVPWVLYHAGPGAASSAGGAANAERTRQARASLAEHLARVGLAATVEPSRSGKFHRVRWRLPERPPAVSLVIPTRDRVRLLQTAVESILTRTAYPAYEIVVVDNQSREPEALAYLDRLEERPRVRVLRYDFPFNFSALNNFAARHCESPLLGLVNNDVEAINPDWLSELVSHAVRPEVGAVGPMLYYPDGTIQSAGILVGVMGTANSCLAGLKREDALPRAELVQNYSAVTGACLLTRAELFAAVGGLDAAELAVAYNDVDYCLKLRERGYLVTWTPYAELFHHESATRGSDATAENALRFHREQRAMASRWPQVLRHDPYYNPNLAKSDRPFALSEQRRVVAPWLAARA